MSSIMNIGRVIEYSVKSRQAQEELAYRVRRGAAFLDASPLVPADWRDKINPDTLDLKLCYACVLGQIFHGYGGFRTGYEAAIYMGLIKYGDSNKCPTLFGFATKIEDCRYLNFPYTALTQAWITYLQNYQATSEAVITEAELTTMTEDELVAA